MFKRIIRVVALAVLSVSAFLLFWSWKGRGGEYTPVFLTIENVASKAKERSGTWPRSLSEALNSASAEEKELIEGTVRKAKIDVRLMPDSNGLRMTYSGSLSSGDYKIVRRVWKEGGQYLHSQVKVE